MSIVRDLLHRELRVVECSKLGLAGMGFRGRAEVSAESSQDSSKQAGEGTPLTKYAYDSMHEWVYRDIPSRVAPQELMKILLLSQQLLIVWDKGIFLSLSRLTSGMERRTRQ